MNKRFRDRAEAGRQLARQLSSSTDDCPLTIVLALPRGGVPVAAPIAQMLHAPLDLCLVHKLGVPGNSEFAMGAIDFLGNRYLNEQVIADLRISPATIDRVAAIELQELQRREGLYRGDREELSVRDRIVILVDDGLATGATMSAAIGVMRLQQPAQIVVAVPVGFRSVVEGVRSSVDRVVCLMMPEPFYSIGSWYENFAQTTDAEVIALMARYRTN
jgi:putative phosphoribosyl transferase